MGLRGELVTLNIPEIINLDITEIFTQYISGNIFAILLQYMRF